MYLEGQGDQRGYAMAALLVSVAVLAVLMSVALPAWRHQSQREKEAELVFRGEQWVRAINQYQRKNGPGTYPPSLDFLVQQRFARKKWLDPITGEEFRAMRPGQPAAGSGGRQGGRQGGAPQPQPPTFGGEQVGGGGVIGVSSTSTATSIRDYKGATRYDQWQFISGNIGAGVPGGGVGAPAPGGRGGRGDGGRGGQGRGGFGQPPGGPRGGGGVPQPPGGPGRGGRGGG